MQIKIPLQFIIICLCLLFPLAANTQEAVGKINWEDGFVSVIAYGTAKPSGNRALDQIKAKRAAQVNGYARLLEQIKGVKIDARTLVEDSMLKKEVISARVSGLVKGAEIVTEKINWEGGFLLATIEMRICMSNQAFACNSSSSIISTLNLDQTVNSYLPKKGFFEDKGIEKKTKPHPSPGPGEMVLNPDKPVTGLIFNLDGIFYERELLPVIVTPSDSGDYSTVYSVKSVSPKICRNFGVVRHAGTVKQARKSPYLGDNIMVIPATKVTDENMIVISNDNANNIYESIRYGNDYLTKAKVTITLN